MKAIRRILVGIKDPSTRSLPAVAKAADLARASGAELTLFNAISMPVAAEPYIYLAGGLEKFQSGIRRRQLEKLERIARRLRTRTLKVSVAADWDYPVHEAIVREARRVRADLIVAEAHAGRRLAPWLLHLTDWELLRTSPVPVLLVKSRRAWRRPLVLAAIDPSHTFAKPTGLDARILQAGTRLASILRGSLHAMYSYAPVPAATMPFIGASSHVVAELMAATETSARTAFEQSFRHVKIPRGRRHLMKGAPIEAIPRTARALGAGIVVMGAISRSAIGRVLIGNTAERVLGALPCDVLVVKPARFVTRVSRKGRGVRYIVSAEVPVPY